MYNAYFAQHKEKQKNLNEKDLKYSKWVKKYGQKVQPKLINNYNNRVNRFIAKMCSRKYQDQFRITQTKNNNHLFRQISSKDSFLGDASFKFKTTQDWKKQQNRKLFSDKFENLRKTNKSMNSEMEYKTLNYEFRSRNKSKQIHPPMHYMRINRNQNLRKKQNENDCYNSLEGQKIQTMKSSSSKSVKGLQDDEISLKSMKSSQSSIKNNHDDEMKSFLKLKNKVHFKRIIKIQQSTQDKSLKKSLNNILIRCGIKHTKLQNHKQSTQIDNFTTQFE